MKNRNRETFYSTINIQQSTIALVGAPLVGVSNHPHGGLHFHLEQELG
jgi:hypothetical protein